LKWQDKLRTSVAEKRHKLSFKRQKLVAILTVFRHHPVREPTKDRFKWRKTVKSTRVF
jgi:hypothetical protein